MLGNPNSVTVTVARHLLPLQAFRAIQLIRCGAGVTGLQQMRQKKSS